ncbi:MAG: hypothetical protein KDI52_04035 [Xanthomonadales bacterium]|nr:hypothetical protein [Xanthomonadales bacterium]
MNAKTKKLLPAPNCIFCNKTIEQVGGKQIVHQQVRGIKLSKKFQGGGNKDYPFQSFKLSENPETYVVVWGIWSIWSQSNINNAIELFKQNLHPWFCQKCGNRTCDKCQEPINMPMGSDVIYEDGDIRHVMVIGINPGCINPKCTNFKNIVIPAKAGI